MFININQTQTEVTAIESIYTRFDRNDMTLPFLVVVALRSGATIVQSRHGNALAADMASRRLASRITAMQR